MIAGTLQPVAAAESEDRQLTNDDQQLSIAEAISRFVDHQKDSKQAMQGQQELLRFQARIGKDKPITTLHAIDVGDYAKWTSENVENPAIRLDPVKKFLTFANRRGWTEISLARYAAAPRRNRRRFQNADPSGVSYSAPTARLSEERHAELQAELQRLRDEVPLIREAIRVARSDGDVRENAPLDAAREQQQMVTRRIRQLEHDLARVEIVDAANADTELVSISSRVTLHYLGDDPDQKPVQVFTLVDVREADVSARKISTVSPIGQALMGRGAGDEVSIATPRGSVQYRIASIGG